MNLLQSIRKNLPSDLASDELLLVGLSGGADSVCLLLALQELGFRVEALHCNFELRGVESDADEAFCRRLCHNINVPLSVRHFRTRSFAQRHTLSLEMAARQLRYDWFAEVCRQRGAKAVCIAHHRDDNIETLLLNLVRGTGIHGTTGMKAVSELNGLSLLRPLLQLGRQDIEDWLTERGQTWVTDSTNLQSDAAQRNLIRLEVLPLLEKLNPRVRETLQEDIQRMTEAEALYDLAVRGALKEAMDSDDQLNIARLSAATSPRTLLYEWLHPFGFNSTQIKEIHEGLEGESGRVWNSATHRLLRDRGRLLLQEVSPASVDEQVLPLEGLFISDENVRLLVRRQSVDSSFVIPRDARVATFDLEKLELPLTLRRVREGDRMQPFGFDGTRLVSDILTDRKLSLFEKESQLVVMSGERIVWLVGQRVGAGAEVDAATRHVMQIHLL